MLNKKSVDDINVKGKRVLVRCDFNVPLKEGVITDENRLVAALPTIKKLIGDGGKVILCSHLGKPKGEPKPELSLAPVAKRLTELLGQEVKFAADPEVVGPNAKAAVEAMNDGDVVLLENTRYRAEETKNGEGFSKELASLCDVFVNDAFGTAHRAHCSNVGVTKYVDTAVVGYLMQKEIDFLGNAVNNPVRPFVAILGGAKVADKLNVINNLLEKCDTLIIGGGMAYTFIKAQGGKVGISLVDDSKLDYCLDMMKKAEELGKKLLSILKEEQVKKDEPMKSHTTFRVGGPADYFVTPQTAEEVAKVIEACTQEKVPYYIVGNGSNLLVSDKGYEGVIIQIYKQMNQVKVEGAQIHAQAGALLSMIAKRALDAELTGFEFAAGIPGTLGGACVMNAGAYGGEMKDVLKSVTVLTDKGEVKTLAKEELELGYRTSVIAKKGYIVLEAVLELQKGEKEKIQAVMDDLKERRVTKQPLEYPSAGSTFKRPEGYFAGKLIQDAGLRGFQVGGAQVSEKHCGFVINKGNATAADVMELIRQVTAKVKEDTGVTMEPEVKQIGEF